MIEGQSNFLLALGWAVLNSLWQMAFLWAIYQLASAILRKKVSASQKSSLATVLIFIGFTWFVYTFFSILQANNPGDSVIASGLINADGNKQLNDWMNTMLPVASTLYLVLLVLPVFYFIRNYRYVQAIRKYELTKIGVEWRIFIKNMAARMGINKPVNIWISGIVTSPVTIGYVKPVILLPVAAISQLSTQQVEAILLHELAHIRRYDYFINLLIRFIQSILYFNPFVKALVTIVEREREKSCDEMVMQFQYDPYGYASALLTLEKTNYRPKPLAVAASGKRSDLLHRIEWLLGVQKKQKISFNKLAGVLAGLLCFISLNALLILSKPSHIGNSSSLVQIHSPFYLFTENSNEELPAQEIVSPAEMPLASVVNHAQEKQEESKIKVKEEVKVVEMPVILQRDAIPSAPYTYTYVNYIQTVPAIVHQLKDYQEEQVKEVMEASKKVLEDKQWKVVENHIGDAMTMYEKDMLKAQYDKAISKTDWNKMEKKLRTAYNQIDWNSVNENLDKALVEIKMDSLQHVYDCAIAQLSLLQKQLCENNVTGIPDTDISLKNVEETKANVQKAINTLIKVRTRKIVHL